MSQNTEHQGERLLHAVERILSPPEEIRKLAASLYEKERTHLDDLPEPLRQRTAQAIVRHYSLATAVGGGLSSLPALLPGVGTVAALVGGGLADMTLCLKFEVEMIMALASVHGRDITRPEERSFCLLLAGLGTYQELAGKSAALDLALVEGEALWQYTPRQMGKLLGTVFLRLALLMTARRLIRGLPLVGIAVGFAANKILTHRVGMRAITELQQREQRQAPTKQEEPAASEQPGPEPVVDADVVDSRVEEPGAEKS